MTWIASFIIWLADVIGNFGWAITLLVIALQILLTPCKVWMRKNQAAKKKCEPELQRIRKKYNATQLGVSMEDPSDMDPDIKKMSHDERDEAMGNEIAALYKENGYHMWTAWIPTVLNLVFIILLWQGINRAVPNGFFEYTVKDLSGNATVWNAVFLFATPVLTVISGCVTLVQNLLKGKKNNIPLKPVIIAGAVSLLVSTALSIWIATSITTALAIALCTLQLWSMLYNLVEHLATPHPAQ